MSEKTTYQHVSAVDARSERDHYWRRWNLLSTASFAIAAGLGLLTIANNIRHTFWNNFIRGFGEIRTPFSDITDRYTGKFQGIVDQFQASRITAVDYRKNMRATADQYRDEVFRKLETDFNIPSKGIGGWTVGTVKRFHDLGFTSRVQSTIGMATIASTVIGAAIVIGRQHKTSTRIESKIDEQNEARGR